MTSRQLEYYYRNKARILAKRKNKGKNVFTSNKLSQDTGVIKLRLHDLTNNNKLVNFNLLEALKILATNKISYTSIKQSKQYWFSYENSKIRLTSNYLIVYSSLLAPISMEAQTQYDIAKTLNNATARKLEHLLTIQITSQEFKYVEVEITPHELSNRVLEKGIIPLYYEPDTKELSIWTDKSLGLGGLESNKIIRVEQLRLLTNDIAELYPNIWNIKDQLALNQQIMENQLKYVKNIDIHMKFMYKALKRFDDKLEGRRHKRHHKNPRDRWEEEENQRKLREF